MLPRKYKLRRENDFKKIFKQGKHYQKDFIRIRFLKNNLNFSRFAFVVGTKISKKATQRNKIRRQLEEIIRLNLNQIKTSFDIIILVELAIIEKNYKQIEKVSIDLLKESKLIA
jgi:ribonuclease P protein component